MTTGPEPPAYFETICQATLIGVETATAAGILLSTGGGAATGWAAVAQVGGAAIMWSLAKQANIYICTDIIQSVFANTDSPSYTSDGTTAVTSGDVTGFVTVDNADNTVETILNGPGWTMNSATQYNGLEINVVTNIGYSQDGSTQTLSVTVTTDSSGNSPIVQAWINGSLVQIPDVGLPIGTDSGGVINVAPDGTINVTGTDPNGGVIPPTAVEPQGDITIQAGSDTTTIDSQTGEIDV
jgi:hypothetical protein